MHRHCLFVISILFCSLAVGAQAAGWPQFRGPQANGIADGNAPPLEWTTEKNVAWSTAIPGSGHSSPIVWEDRIFVTSSIPAEENAKVFRFEVLCLNAKTGELLWSKTAREIEPPFPIHRSNSYATETPVTDGKHLYVCFGRIGLFCYSMDGELRWEKNLDNVPMRNGWGTASSPALHDGTLFLQCDNDADSFIAAFDAKTGNERWRVARPEPSCYGTPIVWKNSVRTEIVTGGLKARSYDPKDGTLLWELGLRGGRASTSPVPVGDRIYIGNERRTRGDEYDGGGFLFAVKAGGKGDISLAPDADSGDHVAWVLKDTGLSMASPITVGGNVYVFPRGNGLVHVYSGTDGKPVLDKQRLPNSRKFWASPWSHGGHVFAIDDQGTTFVIRPDSTFDLVGTNPIDGIVWASPAVHDGSLYIRTLNRLFCIR